MVDEQGVPVRLLLTAGHASDKATAPALIEGLPVSQAVIADRGYDWQHLVDLVASRGGQAHIPTQRDRKQQRSVDRNLYRQRNLIERFFCKLKHFRRVPTHLPGMMTREEIVSTYCERMGFDLSPEQWRFYEVFGYFRLGVIAQQIYYRYFHGQTTNELYALFGPAAHLAEEHIRTLLADA